jgi:glycosyltransferase involved in cell wall biosynthesis
LRIIIITYYFEPRLGYQEPNLAKELAKLGHDVYVVTSNKRYPADPVYQPLSHSIGKRTAQEGFLLEEGIKVIRLRARLEIFLRTWLKNLEKTVIELKPDVVQVNGLTRFSSFRIAFLKWRKRLSFKLVYDEHMVYSVVRKNLLGKAFYLLFRTAVRPLLLAQGGAFIAVTEETSAFMKKECGIPLSKTEVIPLGVNHHVFKVDEASRKSIRKFYDIPEDDVVFIYVGKVIPRKGPHLLIDAGLRLFENHKHFKLFFLGDGESDYIHEMQERINKTGFTRHVIWHKGVENRELFKFYSAADVGVWPLQETITTLEASSCGLPIIIKNSLSLRDRISHGNGLEYRAGDTGDLARCMKKLLLNKALRKGMGKRGRELIEQRMSWGLTAKRYVEVYRKTP